MKPLVVVVGRPNVGKSSLVNRIVGRRAAVVQEAPGVTRDRKVLDAEWNGVAFSLVDTGGWLAGGGDLEAKVSDQAERAVAEADLVLFVVDVTVGVTDEDLSAARVVRRTGTPVLLVVNKVDDAGREAAAWEFVSLGVGDPWPVSAIHGRGTGDLLDRVVALLPATAEAPDVPGAAEGEEAGVPRVALVGRPNVGKSTLFNRLIGEDRSIVHDMPGTTRDAIDTVVTTPEGPLCFVDTAGMRRRSKTERGTEPYSVLRALDALEGADIALLVIDATVGATHQDQRLAERIGSSGCPAVVVLNKWDLVPTGRARGHPGRRGRPAGLPRAWPRCCGSRPRRGGGPTRSSRPCTLRSSPTTSGCRPAPSTGPCATSRRPSPPRARASATASRAPSTRRPSRCSPPGGFPRPTSATSSAGCASTSSSGRRR